MAHLAHTQNHWGGGRKGGGEVDGGSVPITSSRSHQPRMLSSILHRLGGRGVSFYPTLCPLGGGLDVLVGIWHQLLEEGQVLSHDHVLPTVSWDTFTGFFDLVRGCSPHLGLKVFHQVLEGGNQVPLADVRPLSFLELYELVGHPVSYMPDLALAAWHRVGITMASVSSQGQSWAVFTNASTCYHHCVLLVGDQAREHGTISLLTLSSSSIWANSPRWRLQPAAPWRFT